MKVGFDEIDHFHPNFDESVPNPPLTPVLEKEEWSGDTGRSTKRGALPEARSSRTIKRGKALLEPSTRQLEHREQLLQADLTT